MSCSMMNPPLVQHMTLKSKRPSVTGPQTLSGRSKTKLGCICAMGTRLTYR